MVWSTSISFFDFVFIVFVVVALYWLVLFISLFFQTRARPESHLQESLPRDLSRDLVVHDRLEAFWVFHRHEANIWPMVWEMMSESEKRRPHLWKAYNLYMMFDTNLKTAGLLQECCQFQRRNYSIYKYLSHFIVYNRCGLVEFNLFRSLRTPRPLPRPPLQVENWEMSVEKSSLIYIGWKMRSKTRLVPCACVDFLACCTRETGFHCLTIKLRAPCLPLSIMDESHNILVFVLWDHIGWVPDG